MVGSFKIEWMDWGSEPHCPPNPAHPNGIDLDGAKMFDTPTCRTELPYPAKRCGLYYVECNICGTNMVIATTGCPDDPRSVDLPCKLRGGKQ
jgi:hypothetical protein